MTQHVRKPVLPALSGIRTVLAITIIFFHFTPPHMQWYYPVINTGFVFVGMFFLISGFILTYNYADRAATLRNRDFWIARFARVYPVYLVSLILFCNFLPGERSVHTASDFWLGVVLTPLMLQGWHPWLATFWNTVAWTLSCEAMMYLAFPWLNRLKWPRTVTGLVGLGILIWLLGLIPHSLYVLLNPDHLSAPADRYTSTTMIRVLKYTPLSYVSLFLSGIVLGRLHPLLGEGRRLRFAMAATGLILVLVFIYGFSARVPYILEHGGLMTPLFGLIILGLAGDHPLSWFFGWTPLVLVGNATFCIYLLHFNAFIEIQMNHWTQRLHVSAFDPWISYVAIVVFALLINRFVELPMKDVVLNWFHGKKTKPLAKPAAL